MKYKMLAINISHLSYQKKFAIRYITHLRLYESLYLCVEFMLGLNVFRQTGPPRRVDGLASPPVYHMKMEASR